MSSFRGNLAFLSNFYAAPVSVYGVEYPTLEHAYVAAKTLDPAERERVLACATPGAAKKLGRTLTVRPDWQTFRVEAMERLLERKFSEDPLRSLLTSTYPEVLIEQNQWHDNYWGNCCCRACDMIVGENTLGRLLMSVRDRCAVVA